MNLLVSIITPSYNSSKYIEETIWSVVSQTYKNWEMIIVDDMSPDNANIIIDNFLKNDSRIQLIKLEKNVGVAEARNIAIEQAKGRYIAFLDSDDIWLPQKLEKQINFMQEHDLSLTYSSYYTINENSTRLNTRKVKELISYRDMLKSNHIGNLTGIYDCDKLGKVYMDSRGHEDYILWLKVFKEIKQTRGIVEPLAEYRILANSLSSNKLKVLKWQWHIYRKVEKLNIFQSSYYFLFYIYYALKKRS